MAVESYQAPNPCLSPFQNIKQQIHLESASSPKLSSDILHLRCEATKRRGLRNPWHSFLLDPAGFRCRSKEIAWITAGCLKSERKILSFSSALRKPPVVAFFPFLSFFFFFLEHDFITALLTWKWRVKDEVISSRSLYVVVCLDRMHLASLVLQRHFRKASSENKFYIEDLGVESCV